MESVEFNGIFDEPILFRIFVLLHCITIDLVQYDHRPRSNFVSGLFSLSICPWFESFLEERATIIPGEVSPRNRTSVHV